jgi:catechol 2,3-dioxygenase-like lactoylglutathione lyase family enzyme
LVVERTDFVSVPVTDLERSTRFYEATLGVERVPGLGGRPELFRDPDGNVLMLHRRYAPRS